MSWNYVWMVIVIGAWTAWTFPFWWFYRKRQRNRAVLTDEHGARFAERFNSVFDAALDAFGGDSSVAVNWLTSECVSLGNKTPLSLIGTAQGFEAVLTALERIKYGGGS